jgi:hypothetical protein
MMVARFNAEHKLPTTPTVVKALLERIDRLEKEKAE